MGGPGERWTGMGSQCDELGVMMRVVSVMVAAALLAPAGCERGVPPAEEHGGVSAPGHVAGHSHAHAAVDAAGPATARGRDDDPLAGPRVVGAQKELVEVVNRYCPLLVGQSVGAGKRCERVMTRTLGGRLVGFCDAECLKAWDEMSEARRGELLEEALALEAKSPPAAPGGDKGNGGMGG